MKTFEPIIVDEKINKVLIKAFNKLTYNNFQLTKINDYTYFCKKVGSNSGKITRYNLYILLNEFTSQMYIGITKNIKKRLITHARDQILGSNNDVVVNALFIVELDEILTDKEVLSINSQITSIEYRLAKYLRNLGYDARCQFNEFKDNKENGFIESFLIESLNDKFIKQKVEEELDIIDQSLRSFLSMVNEGRYSYFSISDGEVYHEFTKDELVSLQDEVKICEAILAKKKKEYKKSDWEFIRKCLFHKGFMISLWEQGIGNPDDMIVLKKLGLNYDNEDLEIIYLTGV
ncbi:GIY-YIG nuclease family protein [Bacillus sp. NEB1478]|uniref:GIY-YIG nuclease family protein n=1 Tax=Bacillus sp. NEB1478 TaxID=3073816 RepID=UPI002873A2AD|nr:GIY-YIG nuclease family protein [Bacillus sp. NEB1478]WNB93432.1 hypothetical protein RGB74_07110 [Bacillus sp. NEB1478]